MELKYSEKVSVLYHNIFNYPLTLQELKKWTSGITKKVKIKSKFVFKNGFYFVRGNEKAINIRKRNEKSSKKKRIILNNLIPKLSVISSIKFIGITGALAMNNADKSGDIDLIIVTSQGKLWTTRLLVYLLITILRFKVRSPRNNYQENKLCLNMWLDSNDLVWPKTNRNLYTAHEISQIIPVLNRDLTYEKFIYKNAWISKFWPNAVDHKKIRLALSRYRNKKVQRRTGFVERISFYLQYQYMKSKITREEVSKTRAIFHPKNWSNLIFSKLDS